MTEPAFALLQDVVGDDLFPEVDVALRAGRHVDQEDFEWYAFLVDAQPLLEPFYRRYGWELVRVHDGFFYLRPAVAKVRRRQISVAAMLAGQALAYLYLDPATLQASGLVARDQVLEILVNLVGQDRLLEALNPRRRRRDSRVEEAQARLEMDRAFRALEALGFIQVVDDVHLRLRLPLLRFVEPVRGLGDPREALARMVSCGDATVEEEVAVEDESLADEEDES